MSAIPAKRCEPAVSDECGASSTRTVAGEEIPRPTPIAIDGVGQVAQDETECAADYFLQQGERDRLDRAIRDRLSGGKA